jgi:hypothetical protein
VCYGVEDGLHLVLQRLWAVGRFSVLKNEERTTKNEEWDLVVLVTFSVCLLGE